MRRAHINRVQRWNVQGFERSRDDFQHGNSYSLSRNRFNIRSESCGSVSRSTDPRLVIVRNADRPSRMFAISGPAVRGLIWRRELRSISERLTPARSVMNEWESRCALSATCQKKTLRTTKKAGVSSRCTFTQSDSAGGPRRLEFRFCFKIRIRI